MNKLIVAHELGHAVCAEVQDGFWFPLGLGFEKDESVIAYCYCDKHDKKKPNLKGPYSKTKSMMNLGGLFGELLYGSNWSPWGARADIDEFVTTNSKTKNKIMIELDSWTWVDDDNLSFRACTRLESDKIRREFVLDAHETARRLPNLWEAYLDFCDRIDKKIFFASVDAISTSNKLELNKSELKKIIKEIII